MTEPIVIGLNENKWLQDATTKMITLGFSTISGSSITDTLNDLSLGTAYQIPAGKKLIILNISVQSWSNANLTRELWISPTVNSRTGIMIFNTVYSHEFHKSTPVYIEAAASQYINFYCNAGDTMEIYLTCIETGT